MARIPLSSGFSLMAEGEHVLMISDVDFKEDFGKLKLTMVNAAGKKHFENFTLFDKNGDPIDGACKAFSGLARAATGNDDADDIDPNDLKGLFIKGTISYHEYEGSDGKMKKTTQKEPNTWWESVDDTEIAEFQAAYKPKEAKTSDAPTPASKTAPKAPAPAVKKPTGNFDLNALLGR